MKNFVLFFIIFITKLTFGQQAQEFRIIKEYFDQQEVLLKNEFVKKYQTTIEVSSKELIKKDFSEFMYKLDSIRNSAYLGALIKVKNREDIKLISNVSKNLQKNVMKGTVSVPEYPNGINALRNIVANLFYKEQILSDEKELQTLISFMVDKDGTICDIKAQGDNASFNKQAEIAMYLIPEKFSKPAFHNGEATSYIFRMPLTMKLE